MPRGLPIGRRLKAGAKGFQRATGYKRIVISFEEELFDEIETDAKRADISFGEQVRMYVEWGIESAKDKP